MKAGANACGRFPKRNAPMIDRLRRCNTSRPLDDLRKERCCSDDSLPLLGIPRFQGFELQDLWIRGCAVIVVQKQTDRMGVQDLWSKNAQIAIMCAATETKGDAADADRLRTCNTSGPPDEPGKERCCRDDPLVLLGNPRFQGFRLHDLGFGGRAVIIFQ